MQKAITPLRIALLLGGIVTVLLIGLRFDATWAGGDGYKTGATFLPVETVTPEGEPANSGLAELTRGETLETGPYMRQFKTYGYNEPCSIWLDQNTTVVLADTTEDNVTFSLITGRVVVKCKAAITAREARVDVDGVATAVNYSWLHTLDAALVDGTGTYTLGEQHGDLNHDTAVSMDTIDNTKPISTTGFTPSASAAATFYDWALLDE